jgi:hypothetical protein
MDPTGLALAVFSSLKEVYLLSRFVIRTISSASHHLQEKRVLLLKFNHEFLFLSSFRFFFLQDDGTLVDENSLDRAWLMHIQAIMEHLRALYADYTKVAVVYDEDYCNHSPYLPDVKTTRTIDFSLAIDEVSVTTVTPNDIKSARWGKWAAWVDKMSELKMNDLDWKWALFKQRRLLFVLKEFKSWNTMLKDLVPITLAGGKTASRRQSIPLSLLASEDDAKVLGLPSHTQLRELVDGDGLLSIEALELPDCLLETPQNEASELLRGNIWKAANDKSKFDIQESVLVEYKTFEVASHRSSSEDRSSQAVSKSIIELANLLNSSGESDLGTLPFKGLLNQVDLGRIAFVFDYPHGSRESSPISLHDIMTAPSNNNVSLTDRFKIAHMITKSVWTLHTEGWVHKSIRSHSIVFFSEQGKPMAYEKPCLVDFAYSRPAGDRTSWTFDDSPDRNIYRHPDRQGPPRASFSKIHDIYALGIVLLEIGLW